MDSVIFHYTLWPGPVNKSACMQCGRCNPHALMHPTIRLAATLVNGRQHKQNGMQEAAKTGGSKSDDKASRRRRSIARSNRSSSRGTPEAEKEGLLLPCNRFYKAGAFRGSDGSDLGPAVVARCKCMKVRRWMVGFLNWQSRFLCHRGEKALV